MVDPRENGLGSSPQSYGHTIPLSQWQQNSPPSNSSSVKKMYCQKKLFTSHQELPSHGGTRIQIEEQLTKDIAEELRCQAVNNLREINSGDMVLIRK
jgi:hypothetical protein